ncbi:MAG: hypothetical protein J0I10_08735 [Verrucomicrobia bacterium]|nr:hypothetical protein [Verrucomicrobiota bacterium]
MSQGWSATDKSVAHKAAARAEAKAEAEVLELFRAYPVKNADDLWRLELQIREWRRERKHAFTLNFERAEDQLAEWLHKAWLSPGDLAALSDTRRERIRAKTGYRK